MLIQSEAILCRALFPIQDTPSVKSIYKVKTSISSPLTFLFGGILKSNYHEKASNKKNIYFWTKYFDTKISKRCGVWTEKGLSSLAAK